MARYRLIAALLTVLGILTALPSDGFAETARPAPATTTGLLAEGTPYETSWWVVESGRPGPTVLVTGGIHGNEPAGAAAADEIRRWPLLAGRLVCVPRCDVPALEARRRTSPGEPQALADLNRNFPLSGKDDAARNKDDDAHSKDAAARNKADDAHNEDSAAGGKYAARGTAAQAIWTLAKKHRPDYVLDLHEGGGFRAAGSESVGSSIIRVPHPETAALQDLMLAAVNATVTDPARRFARLRGASDGSLARACGERLGSRAFILETTFPGQPLTLRVRQHCVMVRALLERLGMVAAAGPPRPAAVDSKPTRNGP
jgi:predicted deacylase